MTNILRELGRDLCVNRERERYKKERKNERKRERERRERTSESDTLSFEIISFHVVSTDNGSSQFYTSIGILNVQHELDWKRFRVLYVVGKERKK